MQKIIGSDVIIGRAYNELDQFNWTEDRRLAYDQSKKRTDDYHSTLSQKFNEGIKIGEERDKAEGIAKGGKQAKIEVAKNLLEDNVPIDVIYRTTGLPIDKIKELASQE